ncbi:hypothetical protein P405_21065 [Streptomyces sp. FR-008]|nr:hypothetical protein P405_21065 [Streptomyces sp. FR-008]
MVVSIALFGRLHNLIEASAVSRCDFGVLIPLHFPHRSQTFSQLGPFSQKLVPLSLLRLDVPLKPLSVRSRAQVGQSTERLAQIGAAALPLIALEHAHAAQFGR